MQKKHGLEWRYWICTFIIFKKFRRCGNIQCTPSKFCQK